MDYRIVVHYAELALKGNNRGVFVKKLKQNVKRKIVAMGLGWEVISIHDRMFVKVPQSENGKAQDVANEVARLPGIAWLSLVRWFDEKEYNFLKDRQKHDLTSIHELLEELAKSNYQAGQSFALRVKRSDKNFTKTSQQLAREFASTILEKTAWENVDLKNADQFFYVNISSRGISVHTNKIKATGGLPVSSTGRVLTLLSGGFDSPVAAWLMANRGCNVDFVHFSASHHNTKNIENYKISRIVQKISEVTGRARLFIVPYTHFDMALLEYGLDYDLILFRRFMARVAEKIMSNVYAQALVTGDNLGQVASQTMENINSMNKAIDTPILRPLLTYNKEQIIDVSKSLGLYEVCCEPYKDCCALISKNPRTKSDASALAKMESRYLQNYDELMTDTLAEMTEVIYNFGQFEEINCHNE